MNVTRRNLAITGAVALGTAGLLHSSAVLADASDEAAVKDSVEVWQKQDGGWKLLARQGFKLA